MGGSHWQDANTQFGLDGTTYRFKTSNLDTQCHRVHVLRCLTRQQARQSTTSFKTDQVTL